MSTPPLHLRRIGLKRTPDEDVFPLNLPLVRQLKTLELRAPVTFLVGENGSGKSTLLEGIAAAAALPAIGGAEVSCDETLEPARRLGAALRLGWNRQTRRGFFLRAEDFFNFARRMSATAGELGDLAARYEIELQERPDDPGLQRARSSMLGQRAALTTHYGENLDARSHGESFLKLLQARLAPNGLYLLDEPEAPLSPLRQIALLALLKEKAGQNCQFLIATHSPILMALPGAALWSFDALPIREAAYEELDHVTLTREFLHDPAAFLRRL
jgi:predicted ATPase